SFLALGDVTKVAYWINVSSALSSGATIMLLYWTITLLIKKFLLQSGEEPSLGKTISIIGSGAVGALAYTFSDSFWFSAVESEVYAMSSFFTAFVFWAILKWESVADNKADSDRYLILICYMMGLSIGVHILNLVTIPALGFVYYFKKYPFSLKGVIATFLVSGLILAIVNSFIIPGIPSIAGWFEIKFVNNLGLPFGYGIAVFAVMFIAALTYGIIYSIKKNNHLLNLCLTGFTFILIGYASYGIILIRSNFNPPIDENNPQDIISFVSYLKREQYGDRPLLYGPHFTAELIKQERGEALYRKGEKKYEIYDYKLINTFDPDHETLLPRASSRQGGHPEAYARWMGIKKGQKPSMVDNITFLFRYQLGHMYWRYFLWNFAGRESEIQNAAWLAPWEGTVGLPELLAKNKARNNFFMLPFILGLLGITYHYAKDKKGILVVALLFFLTGMALTLYLNPPPIEPRERDYIFVGSFYAFAIWIGFGVMAVAELLEKVIKGDVSRNLAATGIGLLVPGIMAAQGWDDHDRSNRYHSVDSAKNLLNSCAKNAILFTGGDNDTFPLWYVQEVEGFRTDVRVCNLSLLNTDWYIDQMKKQAYDSDPLPISLDYVNFAQGTNDYLPYVERPQVKNGINLKQYIKLIKEFNPAVNVQLQSGGNISILPTKTLVLPVDTAAVGASGVVANDKRKDMQPFMAWTLSRNSIDKKDLIILDMIANSDWKRPIYFSTTLSNSNYLNLREYMQMEGLAYRLLPAKVAGASQGYVNSDIMYERMMKNYFWRNLDNATVYYDENFRRFPLNARNSFYRLATQLVKEGKNEQAKEVVLHCLKVIPDVTIPYDVYTPQFLGLLFQLGEDKKAMEIVQVMGKRADEELRYYFETNTGGVEMEIQSDLFILNQLFMALKDAGKDKEALLYEQMFNKYYSKINPES
ncbi:MAG: DUF2723 domain-containing protein, partial [Cytophagales bacterium]|nr:DUF2723 domain-containing protein [Cytophagales bacterium]